MKIIEINIIQFGKFKDVSFTLDDGFNIVKGDNESGKSTLLGFIKFALYGVGRKNPNIAVGERERALSWNVGIAAGSLTIEDERGKRYRIERSGKEGARSTYVDRARIIDLENGAEVFEGEVPGEHFLGINAQAYDSMCNIKQLEAVAIGGDAVKGVIDNLLSSGDENMNVQSAIKLLDTERRRLLHTNGRGGLVYESEVELERLKSEHRGAIVFENECVKNLDELQRVELALAKARDEHAVTQRMCDAHDDVLRLQKFDKLRELKALGSELLRERDELDHSVGFDISRASYEQIALLTSLASNLDGGYKVYDAALSELESAESSLKGIDVSGGEVLSSVLDEFGSPKSAETYIASKIKKKKNSLVSTITFGASGGALILIAGAIAIAMNNIYGAMTVAFLALVLLGLALSFNKKTQSAKAEIEEFKSKFGSIEIKLEAGEVFKMLEEYSHARTVISQKKNALANAKFRFDMAKEALDQELAKAGDVLSSFSVACESRQESALLTRMAETMRSYLASRKEIDEEIRENTAFVSTLAAELERFSESDIRARINPEIMEKIGSMSFDRLKAERDAALHRTNQFSQYKAGIERNLAASGSRRSAADIFPEIEAEKEHLGSLKLRLDAVKLAMETINAASMELKSDVTPKIREMAQKNLATVTGGKYNELYIDENMGLSVFTQGATRPIDSLSKGSLDAAYFAVRLALLQTLLDDKKPPLYMDETLSQLDDNRAKNALCAIAEHSKTSQCILFTCQSRDVELARDIVNANLIEI